MRKLKKVSVKLIASMIAVIILISPINVLAAVIAPKIDELLHSDEYIGASDAYLATADIQADNIKQLAGKLRKIYGRGNNNVITMFYVIVNFMHIIFNATTVIFPTIAAINTRGYIWSIGIYNFNTSV